MDHLNESERRFTAMLCDAMIPVMISVFWEIWLEAQKEAKGKNTVQVYQTLLRDVKTWNSSISTQNTEAIVKSDPLFPKLLAAVFVIQVKILSAIRTERSSKKICIKLPKSDVFVQMCYVECAKDIYKNPEIITKTHSDEEREDNLHARFSKHIAFVITKLVPTAEILNTYLTLPEDDTTDMNIDHQDGDDEEDPEHLESLEEPPTEELEPAPDAEGEVSDLPQKDLQFTKTPGGGEAVIVDNNLQPPKTPVVNDSLFDDAPDKSPMVQKLP